ncbi:MAG TPA: hypothetical protein VGG48_01780 [Rhizomicrobium sp.]|jgi:hypothetical protein
MSDLDKLTLDQRADCLALAALADRVRRFPGGAQFVGQLFLALFKFTGQVVIDKAELEDLRGRAAGTIDADKETKR